MIDLFSNMLSIISNGQKANRTYVDIKYNKLCLKVLTVFEDAGYIKYWGIKEENVRIYLGYGTLIEGNKPLIKKIKRISKNSNRVYISVNTLKQVTDSSGMWVLSTPLGVLSDIDAQKKNVGGEVLCKISLIL